MFHIRAYSLGGGAVRVIGDTATTPVRASCGSGGESFDILEGFPSFLQWGTLFTEGGHYLLVNNVRYYIITQLVNYGDENLQVE